MEGTPTNNRFDNLIGRKFNLLSVVEYVGRGKVTNKGSHFYWKCICDCGETAVVMGDSLKKGTTKSCGCYSRKAKTKHGHSVDRKLTPEYSCWVSMRRRCRDPRLKNYADYGGRGIKVCDRWLESYENFLEDMGSRPSENYSLDRIDVDANYTPENCKWSTVTEQNRNKTNTLYVDYKGKYISLKEACILEGIAYHTVWCRIEKGWDITKAIHTAAGKYAKRVQSLISVSDQEQKQVIKG